MGSEALSGHAPRSRALGHPNPAVERGEEQDRSPFGLGSFPALGTCKGGCWPLRGTGSFTEGCSGLSPTLVLWPGAEGARSWPTLHPRASPTPFGLLSFTPILGAKALGVDLPVRPALLSPKASHGLPHPPCSAQVANLGSGAELGCRVHRLGQVTWAGLGDEGPELGMRDTGGKG